MSKAPLVEDIIQQVNAKKKYQQLDPDLVHFIANQESQKRATLKEAVKATTSKLHQVGWAYFHQQPDYNKLLQELAALPDDIHHPQSKQFCLDSMQVHTSTRERLPILNDFYQTILQDIQPIPSLLDLACGFNPLAAAWMPLTADCSYNACDIFMDMTQFLQNFFNHFHLNGSAQTSNLLSSLPAQSVHTTLLLKTLPCLEQAEKDSARRILTQVNTQYLVVSYPVRSIGGREKGMLAHYSQQFESLVADLGWDFKKYLFDSELVYRVHKGK